MAENSDSKKPEGGAVRPIPNPESHDTDWQGKIEKAKEARKAGLASRKGKPVTFSAHTFGPA